MNVFVAFIDCPSFHASIDCPSFRKLPFIWSRFAVFIDIHVNKERKLVAHIISPLHCLSSTPPLRVHHARHKTHHTNGTGSTLFPSWSVPSRRRRSIARCWGFPHVFMSRTTRVWQCESVRSVFCKCNWCTLVAACSTPPWIHYQTS